MTRQMNERSASKWLLVLLGASLALQLVFAVGRPLPFDLSPDAWHYDGLAKSLLHQGTFPSAFRSPGYPVFVAIFYFFFHESVRAVLIGQAVLSTLSAAIMYCLGLDLFGRDRWHLALLAAALVGLNPGIAAYSGMLLRETSSLFLILLATWLCLRLVLRNAWYGLPLGLALTLLLYVRMEACLMVVVILAGSLLVAETRWRAMAGGALAAVIAVGFTAPWVLHCARHRGYANIQDSLNSNLFCRTWYFSSQGQAEPELRRRIRELSVQWELTPQQARRYIIPPRMAALLPPGDVEAETTLYRKMGQIAQENFSNHWPAYLRDSAWYFYCSLGGYWLVWWKGFWNAPGFTENLRQGQWLVAAAKVFNRVVWPISVITLGTIAAILLWRRKDSAASPMMLLGAGTLLSLGFLAIVTLSESRLRLPYDGFIYLFVAYGIVGIWQRPIMPAGISQ